MVRDMTALSLGPPCPPGGTVRCIVAVTRGSRPTTVAAALGLTPLWVSRHLFAVELTAEDLAALRLHDEVELIEPDGLDYPLG